MPLRARRIAWTLAAVSLLLSAESRADYAFGDLALISSTMGNNSGRLCAGDGGVDFGCPTTSPYLNSGGLLGIGTTNPQTALEVSGTVSATHFVGDGSGLTGVVASTGDRIVSGTTSMVAVSATGYVSLTQAGSNTGWFDPTRGLVTLGVSATGPISGTAGYFSGGLTVKGDSSSFGASGTSVTIATNADVSSLNPGTSSIATVVHGPMYSHLIFDLHNNSGDDAIAFRRSEANNTVVDTVGMVFRGNGNVGIGTTNPTVPLHVRKDQDAVTRINIQNLTAGASAGSMLNMSNDTNKYANFVIYSSSGSGSGPYTSDTAVLATNSTGGLSFTSDLSGPIRLFVNGSERMRINSSGGNVGISTSNPNAKLDVNGTISASNVYVTATTGVVSGTYGYFKYISATNLSGSYATDRISTSGVASGATLGMAVADKGTVSFTLGGTAGAAYLHPTLGFVGPGVSTTGGISGTTGYFSSNVGIGTTNPTSTLHVNGTGRVGYFGSSLLVDQYISVRDEAGLQLGVDADLPSSSGSGLIQTGSNKGLGFVVSNSTFGSAATPQMFIDGNGKVGIGTTSPAYLLHLYAACAGCWTSIALENVDGGRTALMKESSGAIQFANWPTSGSDDFKFVASGATLVTIKESGDVGIGTTNPNAKLDVNGGISGTTGYFSGDLTVKGVSATFGSATAYVTSIGTGVDISSLNPGSSAIGTVIQGPLNTHLIFDLRNNNADDAIAFRRSAANNTVVDTVGLVFRGDGKVGIGTTNPSTTLDVRTSSQYHGIRLHNSTNTVANIYGSTASNDSGVLQLFNSGSSTLQLSAGNGVNTYFNSGNVGIGTSNPNAKLDVNGTVSATNIQAAGTLKVGVYSSQPVACGASYKGMIAMTSAGHICACDGSGWKDVGASYAACTW